MKTQCRFLSQVKLVSVRLGRDFYLGVAGAASLLLSSAAAALRPDQSRSVYHHSLPIHANPKL